MPGLVVGSSPEIGACVPPRGQKRSQSWSSSPNSEGNAKPERQMKTDLDGHDTNVGGGFEPNVNLGFGSKTVGPFSPPRAKNSISDRGVVGLASPILGKRSRTEAETPPSKLALALSPSPSLFSRVDEGGSFHEGGTVSASQDHVLVFGSSRTPSRYPRSSSRSGRKRSFPPRSHDGLPSDAMARGPVDVADGMNTRASDRRGVGGLRKISGDVQPVELRSSDVRPRIDEDKQEHPGAVAPGTGPSDLNNPSPRTPPLDLGVRSCSPTAGSSPRTEVLSGSRFSEVCGDQDTDCALQRRPRQDGLGDIETGMTKPRAGECGNNLARVGSVRGHHPNRQLSVVSVDGLGDGGESYCTGVSSVPGRVERPPRADTPQDRDTPSSCSTPGFSADADVAPGSRSPPVGSCSTPLSRSYYRYFDLSSDRGSVFGSRLRRHVKGRTVGEELFPESRSRHQPSISGPLKAFAPLFSSTSLEAVPNAHDARVSQDNPELNAHGNGSWLIHAHEHVHPDTQEFDPLRFSSSSPSTSISGSSSPSVSVPSIPLLDGKDKQDENTDSDACGSRPVPTGFLPFTRELRSYMKADLTLDSSTRTGLNGGADGTPLDFDALGRPLTSFINNQANDDGRVLRYVDGIEHRDMGGLEHKGLVPSDLRGRASPISVSVSGFVSRVSGDSAAGSLSPPALGAGPHFDCEDAWFPTSLDSRTVSVDRGDGEESEECGLLKSLLESSDPWGLMRKKVLNLPSPTLSEIERRNKRQEEDTVMVRESFGRRGVGYVTPPSMDALLGTVDLNGEVKMRGLEEGGDGDEDSQEILDFRSSQPRTGHFSLFRRTGRVDVGLLIQFVFARY